MIKKRTVHQFLMVALASFSAVALLIIASSQPSWSKILTHHDCDLISDSMISIIANPEKFDGKSVRVSGLLHLEYEDYGLYLSKEDADYLRMENSLRMSFSTGEVEFVPLDRNSFSVNSVEKELKSNSKFFQRVKRFNGVNVTLDGTYDANTQAIRDVSRVLEDFRWYDGENSLSFGYCMKENAKAADELVSGLFHPIFIVLAISALLICCIIYLRNSNKISER